MTRSFVLSPRWGRHAHVTQALIYRMCILRPMRRSLLVQVKANVATLEEAACQSCVLCANATEGLTRCFPLSKVGRTRKWLPSLAESLYSSTTADLLLVLSLSSFRYFGGEQKIPANAGARRPVDYPVHICSGNILPV